MQTFYRFPVILLEENSKMSLIDQIKAAIDLTALAEEAGAEFRNGRSHCPIHGGDNKSAFHIFDNGKAWHCHTTCGAGGDVIEFYKLWKRVDTKTAVRELARRANIHAPRKQQFKKTSPAPSGQYRDTLSAFIVWSENNLWSEQGAPALTRLHTDRGWTDETIITWHLGYNPTCLWRPGNRWGTDKQVYLSAGIVYPHLDSLSAPFWCNIRRPRPQNGAQSDMHPLTPVKTLETVKWMGLPNASRCLMGTHTHQNHETLILVEGEPDTITAWQELNDVADIATLGGASGGVSRRDALYMARYARIFAIYDPDRAGRKGLEKLTATIKRIEVIDPPVSDGDLTDFSVNGGDLRGYIVGKIGKFA